MPERQIEWMGDSLEALSAFPLQVKREVGFALRQAQNGEKHERAKWLRQWHVMEIVCDYDTDAYRGVYIATLKNAIYVLHCYKKKSKKGIGVPKLDANLIEKRLAAAKRLDERKTTDAQGRGGK